MAKHPIGFDLTSPTEDKPAKRRAPKAPPPKKRRPLEIVPANVPSLNPTTFLSRHLEYALRAAVVSLEHGTEEERADLASDLRSTFGL
jgi:hypothetical protein